MSGTNFEPTLQMQANYRCFVLELTRLSRRHGVAVKSLGGVVIARDAAEFAGLVYVGDISSGDLLPIWGELDVSL